jgi:chloride channel protein, CIC family
LAADGKSGDTAIHQQRNSVAGLWHRVVQMINRLGPNDEMGRLGDFTTSSRIIFISLLAIVIGAISAYVALALLRLIGFFTNLFFYGRLGTALVSPAGNRLGIFEVLVPVGGALIIGFMARYGSERIRGHGIPEAIEAILINGSKISPRVAILKPLSSALSIGTGGPFGAEGPIIMTGGAFGSMIAQFFRLSSAERKTLLVAGAAGGMSATFASPVAAVLLAVELLLFEWKPRSLIPVALASATAAVLRYYIIGPGPLFPVLHHALIIEPLSLISCLFVGLLAGALASLLTVAVYAAEDTFRRLPIHWMWWPAIGGFVIGIGGLIFPHALGVGYDTIAALLNGNYTFQFLIGILLVKSIIWSVSLGSGTSGGVLAPLLMMGGALGGLLGYFLPNEGAGFWPLVCMAATLSGTMRAPFTGIIFSLELTHDVNMLLPLLIAGTVAHGFTVLVMRRSILTEKVSRRGYHLSREYAVDPLEIMFVREVMRTNVVALSPTTSQRELALSLNSDERPRGQHLFPVVDEQEQFVGVITRKDLQKALQREPSAHDERKLEEIVQRHPVVAYPDEPLRVTVSRMVETGFTRMPVVQRDDPHKLLGMIAFNDVLMARTHNQEEERHRERILRIRFFVPGRATGPQITRSLPVPNSEPEKRPEAAQEARTRTP